MKIGFNPRFRKNYSVRIAPNKKFVQRTKERIDIFKSNNRHSSLKDHKLIGAKKKLRAFSVTGDIRIVYLPISEDEVIFIDISSHNQVY